MQKKFYLDTCIWRDLLEDRKSGYSFLGESAFQFLKKCRENGALIVVSSAVLFELDKQYDKGVIDSLFEPFIELIIFVNYSEKDLGEADSLITRFGIHHIDALHVIICKSNECDLISRDKHFELVKGFVKFFKPEEVIFD
jgi:PIN domain nuclease of toxin-antitoxin system